MNNLTVGLTLPLFPNIVQPYILNQIIALENTGATIQIIARKSGYSNKSKYAINNVQLRTRPAYIEVSFKSIIKNIFSISTLNRNYFRALRTIVNSHNWQKQGIKSFLKKLIFAKALTYQNFDLIHSHSLFTSYDYLFLQQDFSIPLITTYHGALPPGVPKLDKKMMQMVFDTGRLFLVNTQSAKNDLSSLGCPLNKIHIIPQGINLKRFPYHNRKIKTEKKIILLSVGRLSLEKGHRTALAAVAELVKKLPNIEYYIVGDGPEKKALQELAEELKISNKVKLEGFVKHDDLEAYYSTASVLILPSLKETQGTVLQEAQASGMPVIGSRAGGIPDVIQDNKTGLLFNTKDHVDLANKLQTLIQSPKLYRELSISGRRDVEERFDNKIICRQLLSTYNKMVNTKRS